MATPRGDLDWEDWLEEENKIMKSLMMKSVLAVSVWSLSLLAGCGSRASATTSADPSGTETTDTVVLEARQDQDLNAQRTNEAPVYLGASSGGRAL